MTDFMVNLDNALPLEKPKNLNPLVIYHANCADGFSAAWCFWKVQADWGMDFDFHPGVYNDPPPDVTDRIVYLVDFSYKRDVVEKMLETAQAITLIDHHKTAIDDLAELNHKNFYKYTDLERSGAILAWDYLHNTQFAGDNPLAFEHCITSDSSYYKVPPKLLEHVQDRDLWKFKLAGTREIQANVFSYEYTFENWDKLMNASATELLGMWNAGAAIERKHHKDIKELLNVCQRPMDFTILRDDPFESAGHKYADTITVPAASLPYTFTSDAGHAMAAAHKEGTEFAACYWDTATHRIFSLRSCDNGMDVSEIAKYYNGGGHKHAAGFRVPRDHPLAKS